MISFCKIFYVSFIEFLVLLYFLYRYFMGSDPNVVVWLDHANAQLSLLDPFNEVEYLKQDSLKEPEIT